MLRELVIPCLLMFSIDKDVDGLVVVVKFIRRLPVDLRSTWFLNYKWDGTLLIIYLFLV